MISFPLSFDPICLFVFCTTDVKLLDLFSVLTWPFRFFNGLLEEAANEEVKKKKDKEMGTIKHYIIGNLMHEQRTKA